MHIPSTAQLDEVEAAKIEWVAVIFVWAFIEPAPDEFDWSRYDRVINDAERRGLRVYGQFSDTPQWATRGPLFSGVPDNPRDFRDFCYRVAQRYRGRVHAWGFWNEPNLDHFWDGTRFEYINEILLPGAEAVRSVDASVLVCGPSLAHLTSAHWDDWLKEVIDDAGDVLDVVTHHAYPSNWYASDVTNKLDRSPEWPWDPPCVRDVLEETGWVGRPFWLTETGMESDDYGQFVQAAFYRNLLTDWYDPGRGERDWVDRIFFYHLVDDPRFPDVTFGILGPPPDLIRKDAFFTYRDFIEDATVDDAGWVDGSPPAFVTPGERVEIDLTLLNTGTTVWIAEELLMSAEVDEPGWRVSGGDLPAGDGVLPGEEVTVTVVVEAADEEPAAGARAVRFFSRLRRHGAWWVGDAIVRTMTFTSETPAIFVTQPVSRRVLPDGAVVFSVEVDSETEASFRWRHNSFALHDFQHFSGARSPQLRVDNVDGHVTGWYDCVVTNAAGTVVSETAVLALRDQQNQGPRRAGGRVGVDDDLDPAWLIHRYATAGRIQGGHPRSAQVPQRAP